MRVADRPLTSLKMSLGRSDRTNCANHFRIGSGHEPVGMRAVPTKIPGAFKAAGGWFEPNRGR